MDDPANASQHSSCLAALDLALAKLGTMAAHAAAQKGGGAAGGEQITPQLCAALTARLAFRKALHQGLTRVQGKTGNDLAAAAKHFKAALDELAVIKQTTSAESAQQKPLGYVADVNCGVLPAAPPRQVDVRLRRVLRTVLACARTGACAFLQRPGSAQDAF